jgi:uncharacterized membrane protein YfcA
MDHILGYLATALVGLSLGLIGGGGSILTIPVLVYLFNIAPTLATSYSLFIVGCTSMVGGIKKATDGLVDFRISIAFSIPSLLGAHLSRIILLCIPAEVELFSKVITKDILIMILFSAMMLTASVSMLVSRDDNVTVSNDSSRNLFAILASGFTVGLVTGGIGIGGGFLIIPALVLFAGIPMKKAVGTSLIIIAAKSTIGFAWDLRSVPEVDYTFITIVSSVAIMGIFIGNYWSKFVDSGRLKKGFGWCILLMSVYVFALEVLKWKTLR